MERRLFLQLPALAAAVPQPGAATPLISFRIGTHLWLTDRRLEELLRFFDTHRSAVDELAFFTSATHPPLPLAEMERRALRLAKVLDTTRRHGYTAGINVLATIGHHEENLSNSLATNWQRAQGLDGKISLGCFCPAQPELLDYARQVYTAMAQAKPSFLWIDDDVRLQGHKPVNFACFCDLCLQNFARESGRAFTRQTLAQAFDTGAIPQKLALRRQWLDHNRNTIANLFRLIEHSVHAVDPKIELGFMTGDRFYEGYDFDRWSRILAGPANTPVRWRPGGGFYSDETPLGLVDKANAIGRQVSALPPEVRIIQSELENFPYQVIRKSAHATTLEAAAHMAAGTTGTAFNVLTMTPDPLDEYRPLYNRIAATRPLYARLQSELGRSRAIGLWPAWNRDIYASVNPAGPWLGGGKMAFNDAYTLGEIGIPIAYSQAGAAVTALCGTAPWAFSDDQLRAMLSGGVILDVEAWQALEARGLASLTGVAKVEGVDADASEVLSAHPLNGRFAGWSRDCRQSFWWQRAWILRAASDSSRELAHLADYADHNLGPCMSAFTNSLGGRIVVAGYYPWTQVHSLAKSSQLKSLCLWLSAGKLPVFAETYARLVLWYREGEHGHAGVVALNASLDPIPNLELSLSGHRAALAQVNHLGVESPLAAHVKGDRTLATAPALGPWELRLLTC